MVPQAELISKGYHSLVPGLISIFLEMVWVPSISHLRTTSQEKKVGSSQCLVHSLCESFQHIYISIGRLHVDRIVLFSYTCSNINAAGSQFFCAILETFNL